MSEHHGKVWWSELNTRDMEGSRAYYGKTCGWTFETMPMDGGADYVLAMQDGRPVAGFFPLDSLPELEGVPPHWFTYLAVDDIDRAVEETVAAGGRIQRPPFEVPGTGMIAIVMDPTGAAVGLMTPEEMPA